MARASIAREGMVVQMNHGSMGISFASRPGYMYMYTRLYNIKHFSLKTFGLMHFAVIDTPIVSPTEGFFSRPMPIGGREIHIG